ncbi:MAG TPA: hypothetical protein VD978_30665 [Azospirillum sp.]|nr:hypothetical protein [Azospirillum sp.]
MKSRETPRRGTAVIRARTQAALTLNRAAQTHQRGEAMFRRTERLRRMSETATARNAQGGDRIEAALRAAP